MNNRALTLSLFMAGFAIFFVHSYISSIEEETRKKFGTEVLVVTAKSDIKEMATINETMLQLTPVPKRFLEPAAISFAGSDTQKSAGEEMKNLAGSVAVVPIKQGEQITYNKLTEPSIRTGLAPQVTPGKRAVTVPVDEVTGVGKLIKPGDRVDVIAVLAQGGTDESRMVKTILQDVSVLAVGRHVTNNVPRVIEKEPSGDKTRIRSLASYDGFTSVTLEVEPTQAQTLALLMSSATSRGAITLSLRNNDDTERQNLGGVTLWDVLGQDAARVRSLSNARGR